MAKLVFLGQRRSHCEFHTWAIRSFCGYSDTFGEPRQSRHAESSNDILAFQCLSSPTTRSLHREEDPECSAGTDIPFRRWFEVVV